MLEIKENEYTELLKELSYRNNVEICDFCKHHVPCNGRSCKEYISGDKGLLDGAEIKFKWTCMDFDYGSCPLMEGTPCEGCLWADLDGFEWNGKLLTAEYVREKNGRERNT